MWCCRTCCMPGWAVVCPVHEALWPGSRASCLLSWCSLAALLSRCVVDSYSFPNWTAIRWSDGFFLYTSLLVNLLCHWLVGRADGRGFQKVVPLVRGLFFVCGSRQRRRKWENGLLWWLSCCWLGQCVDWCTDRGRSGCPHRIYWI